MSSGGGTRDREQGTRRVAAGFAGPAGEGWQGNRRPLALGASTLSLTLQGARGLAGEKRSPEGGFDGFDLGDVLGFVGDDLFAQDPGDALAAEPGVDRGALEAGFERSGAV